MNTNKLKSFAQQTRLRLLEAVRNKLSYVLNSDSLTLRDYASSIDKLQKDIDSMGTDALIDKVAYTWFNRLMALRFMDANGYQPLQLSVISPVEGHTQPEILNEAMQGRIPEELKVDKQRIYDLLDGRIPVANPQNEVYRMLLTASCNHLNDLFPFLFEKINDYTELLLPDDLISELSIINDFVESMSAEDCLHTEVIGWLYQFYISELNSELISSKKAYKKDELAPASQLFTPKWIVQYMVDNTLGQVWAEMHPETKLVDDLEFYITPDYKDSVKRADKPIEEIKFFEPCVGSGHILVYAFDLYYKMYEESGYNPSEIPFLILKHNLYGIDIDPRAAQIASFTLMMKARGRYRRFFRKIEQEQFVPNIYHYEDFPEDDKFNNATALGSLIRTTKEEAEAIEVSSGTLFSGNQQKLKDLYELLSREYDVVVTNPPYISWSRMETSLKKYVNETYPETKSDLFATFILRCLELTNEYGLTGYMTPFVWMFISSYEKLREIIIDKHFINNLVQLEYSGFDGATVPICTFTLRKKLLAKFRSSFIRLDDFKGSENQAPKTLEAIQNPNCGWFYTKNQKEFKKIPESNIGYWASNNEIKIFEKSELIKNIAEPRAGLATGDNFYFQRTWNEVKLEDIAFNCKNEDESSLRHEKWYPCNSGGEFRKWFGNNEVIVNWQYNGSEIKNFKNKEGKLRSRPQNIRYYFKEGITWTKLSSSRFAARIREESFVFDDTGRSAFVQDNSLINYILGLFCSKIAIVFLKILNPTMSFTSGDIAALPFKVNKKTLISNIVNKLISISRQEWNSRETSWDFEQNELIRLNGQDLQEAVDLYKAYWSRQFIQLHQNEEELNARFIEIYGLQEELSPDVPLDEITILKDEVNQRELKILSAKYLSGWQLKGDTWLLENQNPYPELPFDEKELVQQFISYAVGCMMGRYSLDKEGLILANQGETIQDFFDKTEASIPHSERFIPDEDAIIPVLDSEWFEDDIVTQFRGFVRSVWGKDSLQSNIKYIERVLGKPLRNYFYRDFYTDHIKRYKKRPIYWMIASPSGDFQVLFYMHRYHQNLISDVLNDYLRPYIEKLENHIEHLNHLAVEGSAREQTQAKREIANVEKIVDELRKYDREVLYPLATERISIDLDDGVLVNYNRFDDVLKRVPGLNDAATRKKVKGFDWVKW